MTTSVSGDELKAKLDRGDDLVLIAALPHRHYEPQSLPAPRRRHLTPGRDPWHVSRD